jgi:hypothetical protein
MAWTLWRNDKNQTRPAPVNPEPEPRGMEPDVSYVSGRVAGAAEIVLAWEGLRQAIFAASDLSPEAKQLLRRLGVRYTPATKEIVQELAAQLVEDGLDKVTMVVHHDQEQQG